MASCRAMNINDVYFISSKLFVSKENDSIAIAKMEDFLLTNIFIAFKNNLVKLTKKL